MSLAHVTAKRLAPALERQWLLGAARFIVLICVCRRHDRPDPER